MSFRSTKGRVAVLATALMLVGGVGGARAITGAELLDAEKSFGVGYVWRIVDTMSTVVAHGEDPALKQHRYDCLGRTDMRAGIAYDAVTKMIRESPSRLSGSTTSVVTDYLYEVCGPLRK